jgi:hypothetical protein
VDPGARVADKDAVANYRDDTEEDGEDTTLLVAVGDVGAGHVCDGAEGVAWNCEGLDFRSGPSAEA